MTKTKVSLLIPILYNLKGSVNELNFWELLVTVSTFSIYYRFNLFYM